jgi:hypothetical protein
MLLISRYLSETMKTLIIFKFYIFSLNFQTLLTKKCLRTESDYKNGDSETKVFTFSDFPNKLQKETWKYLFIQLYQPFEPFCQIGLSLVDLEPQDDFIVPSLSDIEEEDEIEIESNFDRMKRSMKEEELKSPKTPKGDPFADQVPKKKDEKKPEQKKQESEKKPEPKKIEKTEKKPENKTEKPKKTFKFKSLSSDEEEEEKKPEKKEKVKKSKLESSSDDEKPVKKKPSIEGILVKKTFFKN